MPYLALIDRLRSFLKNRGQPVALFVHGFSFSDEHLNAALEDGLRANPQAACFAFQYDKLDCYPGAITLAGRCPNLSILAKDCELARGQRSAWIVGQSPGNGSLNGIFSWSAEDLAATAEGVVAEFELGDFAHFGEFLSSLAGDSIAFGSTPA